MRFVTGGIATTREEIENEILIAAQAGHLPLRHLRRPT
jgi:hypothetical protein